MYVDTMRFHRQRPIASLRDRSGLSLAGVMARLNGYMSTGAGAHHAQPETEAMRFYLCNHAVHEVGRRYSPEQPLPSAVDDAVSAAYVAMNDSCLRLFCYLLLICTREARHAKGWKHGPPQDHHPKAVADFGRKILGMSEGNAVSMLRSNPPDATLGEWSNYLEWAFFTGKYHGGYGGPKWGHVAKALNDFVHGRTSGEIMCDTGWTLAHNGGPIFNKGMLYNHYGHGPDLMKILDVQAAGQIPNLMWEHSQGDLYVQAGYYAGAVPLFQQFSSSALNGAFDKHVDWFVVEAMSKNKIKYVQEKSAQVAKYGASPEHEALMAKAAAKLAAQAAAEKKVKRAEAKKWYTVSPGVKVKKIKIVRAA